MTAIKTELSLNAGQEVECGPSHLFAAHPEGVEARVMCMPWKSAAFTLFTQEVINLHVCGQLHKLFLVMGPRVRKRL